MVRESLGNNNWQDDRIYLLEPQNVCSEVWFESLSEAQDLRKNQGFAPGVSPQADSCFQSSQANKFGLGSSTSATIKIQIPKNYQKEPVISRLTSDYGLTFYITEAILGTSNQEDGLFALKLDGTPQQIKNALDYLLKMKVKISEP
nr:NIL domain-containing protein [Argonema antarcticum]